MPNKSSKSSTKSGLSRFEELTLVGGLELEKALHWVADKIERFVSFDHVYDFESDQITSWIEFYSQKKWVKDSAKFFVPRKKIPKAKITVLHKMKDGEVIDLSFKSNYKVQSPEFSNDFNSFKPNKTVHARMWRRNSGAKGTVIALHGWTMDDQRINALAFLPGHFYKLGLNFVLIELPFHGRRMCYTSSGKRISFPGPHIARTNEGMGQIISDLRRLRLWLESQGHTQIGCIGMSLGGYIASLWASLDELEFCIPIVPVVDLASLAWDVAGDNLEFQALLDKGLTRENLTNVFKLHSPLNYAVKVPINKQMIIAGLADHIVPPKHPQLLWEHWHQPEIHWLSGGHLVHFRKSRAIQKITDFLIRLGYARKSS